MLLGLLLFLFKKLLPLRYTPEQMGVPLTELDKYKKYGLLSVGLFLVLMPLSIYACFVVIHLMAENYLPAVAAPVVAIRANEGFWVVVALFPGIFLACSLIALILRLMLGAQRSAEYRMLSNRKLGVDATRGQILLGALMVAGSAALGYFGYHAGLFLGRDELVVHRMWSLQEERYAYDQVKALRQVRNPERENPTFVIQVKGAPDWSEEQEVSHPDDAQIALLVERTGKRIVRASGTCAAIAAF